MGLDESSDVGDRVHWVFRRVLLLKEKKGWSLPLAVAIPPSQTANNPHNNSTHSYMNVPTYTQDTMTVPLVRCTALPMFEGHPLAVTGRLEASQLEITVLHQRNGSAFFDLTRIHFCVPSDSVQPTGQLASLTQAT